jgi:hypothetical protein
MARPGAAPTLDRRQDQLLRLIILGAFAAFSAQGLDKALAGLLALAIMFWVVVAALRRESVLGPTLTHWHEAAAYAFVHGLVSRLS